MVTDIGNDKSNRSTYANYVDFLEGQYAVSSLRFCRFRCCLENWEGKEIQASKQTTHPFNSIVAWKNTKLIFICNSAEGNVIDEISMNTLELGDSSKEFHPRQNE